MFSRDEIIAAAEAAGVEYLKHNQSAEIYMKVIVDTIAHRVLDNAATVAERYGDPAIEDAINGLKSEFTLAD